MLVKLAFFMQKLKKYLKKSFCHDQQRWGGGALLDYMGRHSCYEGGHRAHGGLPPLGKTVEQSVKMEDEEDFPINVESLFTSILVKDTINYICNSRYMSMKS